MELGKLLEATGQSLELDKLNLNTTACTNIAIRAPVSKGKITLDARQEHMFDMFFIREGEVICRHLLFLPFRVAKGGYVTPGSFAQVAVFRYTCVSCKARQGEGIPADPDKLIPSMKLNIIDNENKRRKAKGEELMVIRCKTCKSDNIVRTRNEYGEAMPAIRPTPDAELPAQLRNLTGQPAEDVLPEVYGVFQQDEVPGVWNDGSKKWAKWEPTTPFERELAKRHEPEKKGIMPYKFFKGMAVPQLNGLIIGCQAATIGSVPNSELYKSDERKSENYFRQFLLGEEPKANEPLKQVPKHRINEV